MDAVQSPSGRQAPDALGEARAASRQPAHAADVVETLNLELDGRLKRATLRLASRCESLGDRQQEAAEPSRR
jgi:hypothetical protein